MTVTVQLSLFSNPSVVCRMLTQAIRCWIRCVWYIVHILPTPKKRLQARWNCVNLELQAVMQVWCNCKPSTSEGKSDENLLRGNVSFAFAQSTSALSDCTQTKKRHGWESTTMQWGRFWGWRKIRFLQFQKKSFQWWSFEAALKPFPSRFWKRWQLKKL